MTAAHPGARAPRLPGTVAEVLHSPRGSQVAAFFDLDGTLVAGFTISVHTIDRIRRGEFSPIDVLRILSAALAFRAGRSTFEGLVEAGLATLSGRNLEELTEASEQLFAAKIADLIYPETRALVRAHQQRGHRVVLTSSATSIQVEPVAAYLGIEEVLCNRFVTDTDGNLTGKLRRPLIWGEGKATVAQRYAVKHDVDLADCYFYADGDEDLALMHLVGHPRPTNPGPALTKVAVRRGWPVTRYRSRGAGGPLALVRTATALSALGPITAGAIGVGIVRLSKRKGLNVLTSTWPQLMLETNGVRLSVVGQENAYAARPAVFIFNHRNNFDALMAAAVVRDDFTFVAKTELKTHPLVGTFGRVMDGVFIDRDDSAGSVDSLRAAQEFLAQKNLSLLIAPEGTRQDAPGEVGPFKKGPFHMALATGLPIVPIVIRNADDVAGRGGKNLNPGNVDIAVLPPIPVADWTAEELPDRITEVRDLFLDILADWPDEDDPRV